MTPEAFNLLHRLQGQKMSLGLERDPPQKKKKGERKRKEERKVSTIQTKKLKVWRGKAGDR